MLSVFNETTKCGAISVAEKFANETLDSVMMSTPYCESSQITLKSSQTDNHFKPIETY